MTETTQLVAGPALDAEVARQDEIAAEIRTRLDRWNSAAPADAALLEECARWFEYSRSPQDEQRAARLRALAAALPLLLEAHAIAVEWFGCCDCITTETGMDARKARFNALRRDPALAALTAPASPSPTPTLGDASDLAQQPETGERDA